MSINEWLTITRAIILGTFGGMVLFSMLVLAVLHDKWCYKFRRWIARKVVDFVKLVNEVRKEVEP